MMDPNRAVENDWWKVFLFGFLVVIILFFTLYHVGMKEHNEMVCEEIMKEFNACKANDDCQYTMIMHDQVKKCM